MQPIIRANRDTGERELVQLRWGLIRLLVLRVEFFPLVETRCRHKATAFLERLPVGGRLGDRLGPGIDGGNALHIAELLGEERDPALPRPEAPRAANARQHHFLAVTAAVMTV